MQDKRLIIDVSMIQCIDIFPSTICTTFIEWLRSLQLHLCGPKVPHPQNPLQNIPKPLQNGIKTPFSPRLLCCDNHVVPCQLCNLIEDPRTCPQNYATSGKLLSCSNKPPTLTCGSSLRHCLLHISSIPCAPQWFYLSCQTTVCKHLVTCHAQLSFPRYFLGPL